MFLYSSEQCNVIIRLNNISGGALLLEEELLLFCKISQHLHKICHTFVPVNNTDAYDDRLSTQREAFRDSSEVLMVVTKTL
jgi:hypothetical protein